MGFRIMKLRCQGTELSDALSKVTKALPVKRSNPILDGVKLTAQGDILTLFATDLELAIEKKINAEVLIEGLIEGECVVPGKLFADYAKKIEEEEIELELNPDHSLSVKYLDSEVKIKGYDPDDYPVFNEVAKERSFNILKKDFKDLINKIIFNVATDEARPALRAAAASTSRKIMSKALRPTATASALSRRPSSTRASSRPSSSPQRA